jgi:hypothetical protein
MMFYLRPYRKQTVGEPITLTHSKIQKKKDTLLPMTETIVR